MTKVPVTKKIQSSSASRALWPLYAADLLTQVSLPALVKAIMFVRPSEIGISLRTSEGQGKKSLGVIKLLGPILVAVNGWFLLKHESARQNSELGSPISH